MTIAPEALQFVEYILIIAIPVAMYTGRTAIAAALRPILEAVKVMRKGQEAPKEPKPKPKSKAKAKPKAKKVK